MKTAGFSAWVLPWLLWLATVTGGCGFGPTFPEGKVACDSAKSSSCPPGYNCVAGFCRSKPYDAAVESSEDGDAPLEAGADAPADLGDAPADVPVDLGDASKDAVTDTAGDSGPDGPVCTNPCQLGATRCSGSALQTCASVGGCPQWGTSVACSGRKVCQGTEPAAACACPAPPTGCGSGAGNACTGNDVKVCSVDADNCVYQSSIVTCPSGKPCGGAFPTAACTCPTAPALCTGAGKVCESTTSLATCALDGNGCMSITGRTSCPTGKPCAGSLPNAACTCPTAPSYCSSGAGKSCVDGSTLGNCSTDANGCVTGSTTSCTPAGQICSGTAPNAACACPTTPTACNQGAGSYCSSSSASVTCTASSGGCLTASTTTCGTGQYCSGALPNGICAAPSPVGWYNDLGYVGNRATNYLMGHPINLTVPSTLRKFGLLVSSGTANAQIALYADSGGLPSTLVASVSGVSVAPGRNEFAPTSPSAAPQLAAGTYWIMVVYSAQVSVAQSNSTTAPRKSIPFTYGNPLPSPMVGTTDVPAAQSNYYILVTPQ